MTKEDYIYFLKSELELMETGCSNVCCINPDRKGMHTNSICQCGPYPRARQLERVANALRDNGIRYSWEEKK